MLFAEFKNSRRPISESLWAELPEYLDSIPPRESLFEYGQGFLIESRNGEFFPHAFWRAPIGYASLEKAERVLFEWFKQFP